MPTTLTLLERRANALHAANMANLRLFLALDDAYSYGLVETFHIPGAVLHALDTARAATAALDALMSDDAAQATQDQATREAADNAEPVFDPDRRPSVQVVAETPTGHAIFMTNDFE